tara:strand:- start:25 stop:597 length:573 start_codon:yes stop_codon:yes gene_type:complete
MNEKWKHVYDTLVSKGEPYGIKFKPLEECRFDDNSDYWSSWIAKPIEPATYTDYDWDKIKTDVEAEMINDEPHKHMDTLERLLSTLFGMFLIGENWEGDFEETRYANDFEVTDREQYFMTEFSQQYWNRNPKTHPLLPKEWTKSEIVYWAGDIYAQMVYCRKDNQFKVSKDRLEVYNDLWKLMKYLEKNV